MIGVHGAVSEIGLIDSLETALIKFFSVSESLIDVLIEKDGINIIKSVSLISV